MAESTDYQRGREDATKAITEAVKAAIETYEAIIFVCENCGRLAYMIDPGDGLITHIT